MSKINELIQNKNNVKSASIILILTLLISNVLGLIRDHYIAQKIPTGLLDTYYAAFRIPDLIFNILILGAIAAAFIPVFTNYIVGKKEKEAWHIANSFLNISIIGVIILAIILAIFMPEIMKLFVPSFSAENLHLTIKLARIMLLSPIFFGISYILSGVLNSFKRFLVYSIAPLIYNLSIIVFTLLLADKYSVYGIVIGVIVGAFLHMAVQIPIAVKLGFRYRFILDWKNEGIKKIYRLMLPRAIGLGANQVMLLVYTSIASTLSAGSIAIYNLADNIQTMPVVVFGTSFATAIFPSLSESISEGNNNKFAEYVERGIRAILYLLIPSGIGIILLRAQIVRLILGSGFFGWEQTVNTANILGYLAISLFAQGLISLLARSFYAVHNTKTPMYSSIISIIVSIILGYILTPLFGVVGLGLSFSIGSIINLILLYVLLRKKVSPIKSEEKKLGVFILKLILSSLIMIVIIQGVKYFIGSVVDMERFWGVLTQTSLSIILGAGAYILTSYLLKCEEIQEIITLLKKRFIVSNKNI